MALFLLFFLFCFVLFFVCLFVCLFLFFVCVFLFFVFVFVYFYFFLLSDSSTENSGSLEPYIRVISIMGVPPPPGTA